MSLRDDGNVLARVLGDALVSQGGQWPERLYRQADAALASWRWSATEDLLASTPPPCAHEDASGLMVRHPRDGVTSSAWSWCPRCGALSSDGANWTLPTVGRKVRDSDSEDADRLAQAVRTALVMMARRDWADAEAVLLDAGHRVGMTSADPARDRDDSEEQGGG